MPARPQILNASNYDFEIGGNATTGRSGLVLDFEALAERVLGVSLSVSGFAEGEAVLIDEALIDSLL